MSRREEEKSPQEYVAPTSSEYSRAFARLRTFTLSIVKELRESTHGTTEHFGDVETVELFARYFIEQRNQTHKLPSKLSSQWDYFDRFVETRSTSPVAIIGAGKMGSALLESWVGLGLKSEFIVVVEPKPADSLREITGKYGIRLVSNLEDLGPVSTLFLAVKPQEADSILSYFRGFIGNNTLIISIMAGKSIRLISEKIGRQAAIVRAMPNIAASIGRGITVAIGNSLVRNEHAELARGLLMATGLVEWIEDESFMDAVTAVSGSGPAYVFLLAEALERAGTAAGLPAQLAAQLARYTVSGSGELLYRSDLGPSVLRKNVTSPGGTTAAALDVLMSPEGLERLMTQAVAAAAKRSKELAG